MLRKKKEQTLINTNVIARHSDIAVSCDQQLGRSSLGYKLYISVI